MKIFALHLDLPWKSAKICSVIKFIWKLFLIKLIGGHSHEQNDRIMDGTSQSASSV